MAWVSRPLGAMLAARKTKSRSKIKASATTEQAIKGQMGQPAACMMVSKMFLLAKLESLSLSIAPSIHSQKLWINLWVSGGGGR
jgi:hypothetical protein